MTDKQRATYYAIDNDGHLLSMLFLTADEAKGQTMRLVTTPPCACPAGQTAYWDGQCWQPVVAKVARAMTPTTVITPRDDMRAFMEAFAEERRGNPGPMQSWLAQRPARGKPGA